MVWVEGVRGNAFQQVLLCFTASTFVHKLNMKYYARMGRYNGFLKDMEIVS
jgi:hypothetical protein